MFKIFMDAIKYLEGKGIIIPMGLFWFILTITIIGLIIVGYKKYVKPIMLDVKKLETKIRKVDDIDQLKEAQNELNDELKEINSKIDNVTKMFVSKQINDMRYEILDFGSAVMNGRKYDKESYDHILEVYDEYEDILRENNMTNGRVNTTMEIIRESYKNKFIKKINN